MSNINSLKDIAHYFCYASTMRYVTFSYCTAALTGTFYITKVLEALKMHAHEKGGSVLSDQW